MERSPAYKQGPALNWFWKGVVFVVKAMSHLSCMALVAMVLVTCVDILLRRLRMPVNGAYDLIQLCGAVTVACAVPMTTARKGHVAIEYFFQKLKRRGRVVVDSFMRGVICVGFAMAAWSSFKYGLHFLQNKAVTDTIGIPVFWVPWLMSIAFAVTSLVILFHLIYPGRELAHS